VQAVSEWFEEFFDESCADAFLDALPAQVNDAHARLAADLLGIGRGSRVLDVPCGTGRLALPLARMGMAVTGVDLMPLYLERAAARAKQEELAVRLVCRDMRRVEFHEEFDATINWGDSIGYFDDAETLGFCRRVLAALRPGGGFLIECTNRAWLRRAKLSDAEVVTRGLRIRQSGRYDPAARRFLASWTYTRGEQATTRHLSMRVYGRGELLAVLRAAGFRGVTFSQSYPVPGPAARDSQRLIAVARRPTRPMETA